MKKLLVFVFAAAVVGCGNGNSAANADSSNVITDSAALMNTDTTSVIGANRIGQGQMRTDTPATGSDAGK